MPPSIDLTNSRRTPFKFANPTTSKADKARTVRVLRQVRKHLSETLAYGVRPNSVSFSNQDSKGTRIIFYDFERLCSTAALFAVVFYANRRRNLTRKFNRSFYRTDWQIAMSMTGSHNILCYASQELDDGNWFNVVLFADESDKHAVLTTDIHKHAATELAPKRFSWIRLHNAYLPQGIMSAQDLALTKTKYYDFDENWFAYRVYA